MIAATGHNVIDWMGGAPPSSWKIFKLKHILREEKKEIGGDAPAGAISFGEVVFKDFNNDETLATYRAVKPGQFLINPLNLNYDLRSLRIGLSTIECRVSPAYILATNDTDRTSASYLRWALRVFDVQHMKTLGAGVRQTVNFEDIGECRIALPTRPEQEQIATYLNHATSRIDALVAKKSRFIELLHEELVSLATNCQAANNTRWVRLRHVSDTLIRPADMKVGGNYTRLGLYNRGRGIFKKDSADTEDMGDSSFHWVEDGDLILSGQFAWEGAVAMARREHAGCVVSHRYPILRGRPVEALSEYLYAYFLTTHGGMVLNDCSRGSAGRNRPLNMGLLMNWKIPVPPLDVQEQIAKLLVKKEKAEALQKRSVALLREHRAALITAAVVGKIDLRNPP